MEMIGHFVKLPGGAFIPATDEDKAFADKIKAGRIVKFKYTQVRNYQHLKKYFALLNLAFDYWEPQSLPDDPEQRWMKKVIPEKNFERFRKDIAILAGYYDASFRVDGSIRIEAKSISFASMSADEFEKLYSATIDVILKQIYADESVSRESLEYLVDQVLSFAA